MGLNPDAPEFVPAAPECVPEARATDLGIEAEDASDAPAMATAVVEDEENVTPQELDELEATEEWVRTMAYLEDLEREHLIELALRNAPSWKLDLIHKRVGAGQLMNRKAQPASARAGFW